MRQRAGVIVPLFSLRGQEGIGTLGDLPAFAELIAELGFSMLGLLPVQRLHGGESSPYGADSAHALDPMYIDLSAVPELQHGALERELPELSLLAWREIARSPIVLYADVRTRKEEILRLAFRRFEQDQLALETERAQKFHAFCTRTPWLHDLTLFSAIREAQGGVGWTEWPPPLRDREPEALAQAAALLASSMRYHAWLQFVLFEQWARVREILGELGVTLFGDVPFGVGLHSADVWRHREWFQLDASLGVPPDAFSATGQNWRLPPFDIPAMRASGFQFFRDRLRAARALYDEVRVDHVVGYFRQWLWCGEPQVGHFEPEDEAAQRALGRELLEVFREELDGAPSGPAPEGWESAIVAEDLGVIPDFVRESLTELGLAGYRVVPWDHDPHTGQLRDLRHAPSLSVATYSTHDTLPIGRWFHELPPHDTLRLGELSGARAAQPEDERLLALFDYLFAAGSSRAFVLATELLGDPARINLPGTVGGHNWTWRMPWTPAQCRRDPVLSARFSRIRELLHAHGRHA